MKVNALIIILFTFFLQVRAQTVNHSDINREQLFDSNWKFLQADSQHAEDSIFDDTNWRTLDLPHDWSIEDLPNQNGKSIIGPFSKESIAKGSTGFFTGGIGWYRKHFTISPTDRGKIINILFDGVYMDCDVWINGKHLGNHPYGFTAFYYELTRYLNKPGQENIIAVRVKNLGKNSRWYSGSGIYRHVWVTITNPMHVAQWSTFITTPEVSKVKSKVIIKTLVLGTSENKEVKLKIKLLSPDGKVVSKSEKNVKFLINNRAIFADTLNIENPILWTIQTPKLYKAIIEIYNKNNLVDSLSENFGVRTIQVSAQNGLLINGEKILLKGGCIHNDNGLLGSATFDRAEERRIELLKANGFNAIRTSHNPPSRQFLNACDKLGMLVIDEAFDTWQYPKNPDDYHKYFKEWWVRDLESMILRDRNHPSVIFWSIGNEIYERADSSGVAIANQMVSLVKSIDPTRLITEAVCGFWDHPEREWDYSKSAFIPLDLAGCNYQWKNYESDHLKYPSRVMLGTESVAYEASENWALVKKLPYVIGDFVWTAMDYMGEAGIAHNDQDSLKNWETSWSWYTANCGDIDICGFKRPQSYYRDVIWDRSSIEIAVHVPMKADHKEVFTYWGWPDVVRSWNWAGHEGETFKVYVFTKCQKVQLELNGKKIDEKMVIDTAKHTFIFDVPYSPGELKAIALNDDDEIGSSIIRTSGSPYQIRLTADRNIISNDMNDLAYVTVEITDAQGNMVSDAAIPIEFSILGAGKLAGIGNGSPNEMASFKQLKTNAFKGKCLVILKSDKNKGKIKLSAFSKGLQPSAIEIVVE